MKKYILYKLLAIVMVAVIFTSCQEDQEISNVQSSADYPVATFELMTTQTDFNEEDEESIVYKVTLDKMLDRSVTISADISGTVVGGDYEVSSAVIAPYTLEGTLTVKILNNPMAQEQKTLELTVVAPALSNKYLLNPSTVFPAMTSYTINNYESPDLESSFLWDSEIVWEINDVYPEDFMETYDACDYMDVDIFVADAAGYDPADPWANWNSFDYAATGDCPEELTWTGWDDGEYYIFTELWANAFADDDWDDAVDSIWYQFNPNIDVPIISTFWRDGVFGSVEYEQDASQVFNTGTPGVADPTWNGEVVNYTVAKVSILNGVYTITGFNDEDIVSGRTTPGKARTPRPDFLRK